MRVWIYARLSNDDDQEMNSLLNQQEICHGFAGQHGYTIVGQSSDDNVSGMKFNRRGLDELTAAVDADKIDAVIVKDLSRLGRHRTQTALFIDYLREHQVRVISATEGIDTFRDEDDLVIGIRGLVNDYYARDISKKIRAGYRQKQREGIVITPPFGYRKDRNTNTIELHPEASETVQIIYSLYLQGLGQKEIARRLNELSFSNVVEGTVYTILIRLEKMRSLCGKQNQGWALCMDICQRKKYPGGGGLYRGADQSPVGNQQRQGKAIGAGGVVPARKLLFCYYSA